MSVKLLRAAMGCSSSVAAEQSGNISIHTTNDEQLLQTQQTSDTFLNEKQRQLIKSSWEQLQLQCSNIGKRVFLRVFEEDPTIKAAFDLGPAWGDDLINSDSFLKQATLFENSITFVVEHVDELHTKCGPHMMAVGAYHEERSPAMVQHFDSMVKSFLFVWQKELKDGFTTETKHAWETLFGYMVQNVKDGYNNSITDKDKQV